LAGFKMLRGSQREWRDVGAVAVGRRRASDFGV